MRTPLIILAALVAACNEVGVGQPHPSARFYFPTGLAHVVGPAGEESLYVVNSNFDRRYNYGLLSALDLDSLALPAFPAPPGDTEVAIPVDTNAEVHIRNFGGPIAAYPLPSGGHRLFVPSREEGSFLHIVEAQGTSLDCASGDRSCTDAGLSLEDPRYSPTGKPRAPQPYDLTITPAGRLFVTHLDPANEPAGTEQNPESYLVSLDAANPELSAESFIRLGAAASASSIIAGSRYLYFSGRELLGDIVLRTLDTTQNTIATAGLRATYNIGEARGLALSPDEQRIYIGGRRPDTLVVAEISGPTSDVPSFRAVRAIAAPAGINELQLIARPGRGSLVVATCTTANSLIVYDEDAGQIVANLTDVGTQPYAVEISPQGAGARLYVTNFGDGQIAVVDIPDLNRAQEARRVARIGAHQRCLLNAGGSGCGGGQ